jgi:hypothetical protein
MTLDLAVRIFLALLGWSLLLQTLEFFRVQTLDRVGDWRIQREEVPVRPAWVRCLLDRAVQGQGYLGLLLVRLALALCLLAGWTNLVLATVLFLSSVLLLFRWRGAFNGGSDFMTLVGVSGLLISQLVTLATDNPALGWRAGLWYITVYVVSSYFVSGWVKLLRPEWRSGRAMTIFLDGGVYGPLAPASVYRHPLVARLVTWGFTVWEGCFPLALFDVRIAWFMCCVAPLFHFLVYWHFGLNRFFWAWLATYPAVLYCALG